MGGDVEPALKILPSWHSTVRELLNRRSAESLFDGPSRVNRTIYVNCTVRWAEARANVTPVTPV
ncbi:hypothetical protein ABZ814_32370, partial [Micromonospora musae]|uniref:hypothetical protein n=1 Tax=Micromonospora musae TaxID=1894970 RepID=UPI003411B6D7